MAARIGVGPRASSSDGEQLLFPPVVIKAAFGQAMVEEGAALGALNRGSTNTQWQRQLRSSISPVHQPFEQSLQQLVNADA